MDRVRCPFFTRAASPALLVSHSITWFTFLFAQQHLAKQPVFGETAPVETPKSKFEIHVSSAGLSAIFLEILECSSSMLSILAFRFTVLSISFRESGATFIDSSFFTIMTTGFMEQFSSMSFAFSIWPCFVSFSVSFSTDCCI